MPLATPPAAPPAAAATPEFDVTMFLPIVVLMGWSKLEIDTSEGTDALLYLRVAFYSVAAMCVLCGFFIRTKIQATNNTDTITVNNPAAMGKLASTVEMTIQEYDLSKAKEMINGLFMPLGIISLMHWKWEYVRPLVMQSIMMPKTIITSQLFQIYILGKPATGKLQRPWVKPASPFAALMGGGAAATPAPVATPAAVKNGKKKKKEKANSSRPSGDTGATEQSAAQTKDTKKTK